MAPIVVDHAHDVPARRWRAFGGTDLYQHPEWLGLTERLHPSTYYYVLGDEYAIACEVVRAPVPDRWPTSDCRSWEVVGHGESVLVAGGRRSYGSRVLTASSGEAHRTCVADALDLARSLPCDWVVFPCVPADDAALLAALRSAGFTLLPAASTCSMTVRWSRIDEYFLSFPRRRRATYRNEWRKPERLGLRIEWGPPDPALAYDLAGLEVALHRKYGSNRSVEEAADGLRAVMQRSDEVGSALVRATRDGELAGFAVLVFVGDEAHVRQVGFDYALQPAANLYFTLLFYEPIRHAVDTGRWTRIHYGTGSLDAKQSRGCAVTPQLWAGRRSADG